MPTWRGVVRTTYPGTGGPGYSTWHFRDSGGDAAAELAEASTALLNAYDDLAPSLTPAVSCFHDGRWVEVDGDGLVQVPLWTFAGTDTTANLEQLPPANQLCITWRTASNSRSGRGRTFLAGWNEGNSVNGAPSTVSRGRISTMIDKIVAFNTGPANGAFCVYSKTQNLARDITAGVTPTEFAVLRSRRD